MSLITISGAFFQWPIGYLSDRFDRRLVIIITALLGSVLTILCFFSVSVSPDFINLSSDWKKQNLIDIQKRLNGWQLESFKESYKHKVENGISLFKSENMK